MKCDSCGKRFDPWAAKKIKINKKVYVYCPHCSEMVRIG